MNYALIDTANTFFRARHVASRNSDTWEKIGMALHLTLASVNQVVRKYGIDHVVFCLEGRSWRKEFYKPYKANRAVANQSLTEAEEEENKMFWETYEVLQHFCVRRPIAVYCDMRMLRLMISSHVSFTCIPMIPIISFQATPILHS